MSVWAFLVNKAVIVDKILISCVIRRIDVDYVYPAHVGVGEGDERVKIVAFDENMVQSIRRRTYNRTLLDLRQDRNPLPLVLLGRLRLVFPDKTILFSLPQRINHLRLFLIAEPWGLQYARYQLLRVCVSHRDALQFMPARPT